MKNRIRYYSSFDEDFFQTDQKYSVSGGYKWIRNDAFSKFLSALIYSLAIIFSNVYCRIFLHLRIRGAKKVRKYKDGFFLYANHTQPIGDVFNPALVCFPKRIYTVVSAANMYLPVLGKLLPYLGALPIPDSLKGMNEFSSAIEKRVNDGHPVIIYPEAHLWEYYTGIRPFSDTSFKFPIKYDKAVFCITSTYQKRKIGKKPRLTLFVDGPFTPYGSTAKEKSASLKNSIYDCMSNRSMQSDCEYIKYIHKQ